MVLRSILCPVDFSEQSRHALRWAGVLARRTNGRLTVVSAVDPLLAEAATLRFGLDLAHADTEPALRAFVAATWSEETPTAIDTRFDVSVGHPADVILEATARERADLVVMGTQGLGGVRKWLLGSTTERVLRRTRTPLFAVPPSASEPHLHIATTAPLDMGPVLAATDFGDTSADATGWAADLARQFKTSLLLAHIVQPILTPPQWQSYIADADDARVADARARLDTTRQLFAGSLTAESLVESGDPAESIAAIAAQRRASVIVMGLASSRRMSGSRPGSIAYRVVCLANCPVLVVPPQATDESPLVN
jgi:nucleotide-binding universal stress UspA family protein